MTHSTPAKPSGSNSPGPAASETPQDARKVERRDPVVEAAYQEVFRLCEGGRWQMTIPVRPDRDSDLLIVAGLDALVKRAEDAEAREARLRAGIEALAEHLATWPAPTKSEDGYTRGFSAAMHSVAERAYLLLATPDADAQDEAPHV